MRKQEGIGGIPEYVQMLLFSEFCHVKLRNIIGGP
jgi:hypothetical protein